MSTLHMKLIAPYGAEVRVADIVEVSNPSNPRDQNILATIHQALEKADLALADLTAIELDYAEGSFTSIKVAVAIANALAYALKLKINGQTSPLLPQYPQEPNITKQREKK